MPKLKSKSPHFLTRLSNTLYYAFGSGGQETPPSYAGVPMMDASKIDHGLLGYLAPPFVNIDLIRSNSRRSMLDSPEMIALARTLRVLVVGDGLKIASAPERAYLPELKDATEESIKNCRKEIDTLFELTAESSSFDATGERNLFSLMADIFDRWIQDGEVFIIFSVDEKNDRTLSPLRISLALPEDVSSPEGDTDKITAGIEIDKNGSPVAYYIDGQRIEKYSTSSGRCQVAHLKFGQQIRGVPPFLTSIQMASVGVIMQSINEKEYAKAHGVELFQLISTDSPDKRDETQEHFEKTYRGTIEEFYSTFVTAIAQGRNISEENIRRDFGKGAILTASQALKVGMIDEIQEIKKQEKETTMTSEEMATAMASDAGMALKAMTMAFEKNTDLALNAKVWLDENLDTDLQENPTQETIAEPDTQDSNMQGITRISLRSEADSNG